MKFSPQDRSAWARVSPYLDQALDLEPNERVTWLKTLETTQPDIAREVERFLSEHAVLEAKGFLTDSPLSLGRLDSFVPVLASMLHQHVGVESGDWPQELPERARPHTTDEPLTDLREGTIVGAYRLQKEIGYGGMSCVWLAERSDGLLKRKVALKLPFEGSRRAQIAERFKREREILATLTHPNIARLYDAGISASGQSYLAMEYVQGRTLTDHCDAARLPINERLKIFLQVLSAVEFAHTQLVLHRDLKPSNILVTDQGRVVLLDFGVAKLLAPEADPERPLTEMAGRMLTPDYASPEHLAGQSLGTTSDVYSLGVVLYELLTGARPFKEASRRALEEAVLKQDPLRPSQSLLSDAVASARHSTPRKLARALSGDLDTIVLKTLKKNPTDRYRSVGAFAQDISNTLQNLPVSARPDSAWYRSRRFVMRHRWQVTAAAVTLMAILVGGGAAVWQGRAAAQQRDRALALASRNSAINEFMDMLIAEAASSEKPVTVNELLARSEKLAMASTSGNNEDRAAILGSIGELLSTSQDTVKATQLFERALALVRNSQDSGLRSHLICDHAMTIASMGQVDVAVRTITLELGKLQADPKNASDCLGYLAHIARMRGDAEGALRYANLALDRFHQATGTTLAGEAALLAVVADSYGLGGDNLQANHYFELALKKYREAGRERSPNALVLINNWAITSSAAGVPMRALALYDQVLNFIAQADQSSRPPQSVINNRALALERIGRYAQARAAYEWGYQLARQAKSPEAQVSSLLGLASVAKQSGDRIAAARYLREIIELLGPAADANSPQLIGHALVSGQLKLADGKAGEARAEFDRVLSRKKKGSTAIAAALGKAEVELLSGDAANAVTNARRALDLATYLQGGVPYSYHAGLSWLMLGRALQALSDIPQARKAFEAAVTHLSNTVDADQPELLRARRLLASSGGLG